jgi:hypothetical protein
MSSRCACRRLYSTIRTFVKSLDCQVTYCRVIQLAPSIVPTAGCRRVDPLAPYTVPLPSRCTCHILYSTFVKLLDCQVTDRCLYGIYRCLPSRCPKTIIRLRFRRAIPGRPAAPFHSQAVSFFHHAVPGRQVVPFHHQAAPECVLTVTVIMSELSLLRTGHYGRLWYAHRTHSTGPSILCFLPRS